MRNSVKSQRMTLRLKNTGELYLRRAEALNAFDFES